MIVYLKGEISDLTEKSLIINVNGVGYRVLISKNSYDNLVNSKDNYHTILIYHHITESTQILFGFIDKRERSIFKLLISVSGIGPKIGIQLLSSISAIDLEDRIVAGEVEMLTELPGIGPKTAKRIIIELKDKFTSVGINEVPLDNKFLDTVVYKDALDALIVLGYSKKEVSNHIINIVKKDKNIQTSKLIKKVLNKIGRK